MSYRVKVDFATLVSQCSVYIRLDTREEVSQRWHSSCKDESQTCHVVPMLRHRHVARNTPGMQPVYRFTSSSDAILSFFRDAPVTARTACVSELDGVGGGLDKQAQRVRPKEQEEDGSGAAVDNTRTFMSKLRAADSTSMATGCASSCCQLCEQTVHTYTHAKPSPRGGGTYWHANKQHRLGTCFQWYPSNICRLFCGGGCSVQEV